MLTQTRPIVLPTIGFPGGGGSGDVDITFVDYVWTLHNENDGGLGISVPVRVYDMGNMLFEAAFLNATPLTMTTTPKCRFWLEPTGLPAIQYPQFFTGERVSGVFVADSDAPPPTEVGAGHFLFSNELPTIPNVWFIYSYINDTPSVNDLTSVTINPGSFNWIADDPPVL